MVEESKYMKQAKKEMEHLKSNPNFLQLLESRAEFLKEMDTYGNEIERVAQERGFKKGFREGKIKGLIEGREAGIKEGREKGIAEGIEEGMQKGIHKEKIKITKKLLKKGLPLTEIQEITELSEDEIKNNKIY